MTDMPRRQTPDDDKSAEPTPVVPTQLPPVPTTPPATAAAPASTTQPRSAKSPFVAVALCAALLSGAAGFWWGSNDADDSVGPLDHVEVSGGKLAKGEADEDCDDYDNLSYNDCDSETTYKFKYRVKNEGDGIASYSAVVNAFDEDGNFIGQDYVLVSHLAPGKTESDEGEFSTYSTLEGDNELSDIATVRIAHVERTALAN
ncbi:hypothetical protein ABT096_15310 [Streptomyces sp. NPDC002561]|uniref:hypothetical protein n=1 Tax=unclassified Streptomyces TaxID=2593676 RepID=UPI00332FCBE5